MRVSESGPTPRLQHNHGLGGDVSYANCPACREDRRDELEAEVDFWGGTVTWDEAPTIDGVPCPTCGSGMFCENCGDVRPAVTKLPGL